MKIWHEAYVLRDDFLSAEKPFSLSRAVAPCETGLCRGRCEPFEFVDVFALDRLDHGDVDIDLLYVFIIAPMTSEVHRVGG